MATIWVYATSLVAPGNKAWKPLEENFTLQFADYEQWRNDFMGSQGPYTSSDAVAWILFLQDFLSYSASELEQRPPVEVANTLMQPLKSLLQQKVGQVVVAYSTLEARRAPLPQVGKHPLFADLLAREIETNLEELSSETPNLYLLSLDRAFAPVGTDRCFDARKYYGARCRLSTTGLKLLSSSLHSLCQRFTQSRKKVLVLDCDNTLWGGVLGEVGPEGIQIGQDGPGMAFKDLQYAAKSWAEQGILLAIVSKNNHQDVMDVLKNHQGMVLRPEDFVCLKINWQDKVLNIQEMARELGLGLDSFVFWDDNPIERDMAKTMIPELDVVDPPEDISDWPMALKNYAPLSQFEITGEDRKKIQQYQGRAKFQQGLKRKFDKTSYLRSINMNLRVFPLGPSTLDRAHQLCLRTNQFNLRTQRHTREELEAIAQDGQSISGLVHLKDDFGDHGLTGLFIARPTEDPGVAYLDTFLMSCRIIGRHVESWMLNTCLQELQAQGFESLLAEFLPKKRNQVASAFLEEHGPERISNPKNTPLTAEQVFCFEIKKTTIPHLEVFE